MVRRIISKCNGCGACAAACHEGAIELVDGKARLRREDYCDGLGDCLPECPTGAITFEEREAAAYDAAAVQAAKQQTEAASASQLRQWPCQIKLAPVCAPYFSGAALLLAADCTAFACASVHQDYMRGRVTLIGCPKLDGVDYSKKLAEILQNNAIESVTVLRMEVPCCGGLEAAAKKALLESGKTLPLQTVTLTINGQVREG